ncbi:immune inhibitor A domain-containing protein [Streptomyces zingiberis]|uniref:M6 family metalloprotease domain-containing protein n=1 Tax=Streptomyces zingiberis TaxID=2053010 RepID=A0ABX1C0Z5_9ACTN|nr:immune inhibitor A domain-containing protein [Streptomyces zingiberis]NJQ01810.1 M6 family metalloprotease domain-containing protein [Streptomyces zingiberis]
MRTHRRAARVAAVATVVAALGATALPAVAAEADDGRSGAVERRDPAPDKTHVEHDLDGPFSKQQEAARSTALQRVLSGEAKAEKRGASQVVKLDRGKYVELGREKTDKIFTILVEFGDKVDDTTMFDPDGPDGPQEPVVKYGGTPGPRHNEIAEPDRSKDNSTEWQADFDQGHYQDLYFGEGEGKESLKKYYEKQSSGRYSVDGTVSDWVKVEWNEARYGSNYCGSSNCANVWDAVRDGVNAWVEDQKAAGLSTEEIRERLAEYDQWDRYDHDGDGDFNEPDGYIDHFQFVHAGEDESAGGGAQGGDAIWAHRWYAYGVDAGRTGPDANKAGGTEIGDTGIWVGDYTVQPENGGLGVFAHEYGHDLGLPDLYDTSGTGESSVAFWSLMSSGSWLGEGEGAIGDMPGDMTAWDKLQLGWLNYETAEAATSSRHKLGVAEYNTSDAQALVVELPEKEKTTTVVAPAAGAAQWWSDMGDDLKNTLSRPVDLTGKAAAELRLKGWWDIEPDYDYLYTEVSADGGATWTPVDGTANGKAIPRDGGDKPALHGASGTYQDLVFPLDAYAGQKIDLRFRYQTDGGLAMKGFAADAISVVADGEALFTDGAEDGDNGWTAAGFRRVGETFTESYPQFYLAENRQYVSYDRTLRTGPYNFGFTDRPDWVEHFPYQNGLMVWLWDTSQHDNNVGEHPGEGLILPVDAHAAPERWADGSLMRNRIQAYDSPFSHYRTDGFTLHKAGVPAKVKAKKGVPVFDDRKGTYWYESNPTGGVKVPDTNTRIQILKEAPNGSQMILKVGPSTK